MSQNQFPMKMGFLTKAYPSASSGTLVQNLHGADMPTPLPPDDRRPRSFQIWRWHAPTHPPDDKRPGAGYDMPLPSPLGGTGPGTEDVLH